MWWMCNAGEGVRYLVAGAGLGRAEMSSPAYDLFSMEVVGVGAKAKPSEDPRESWKAAKAQNHLIDLRIPLTL